MYRRLIEYFSLCRHHFWHRRMLMVFMVIKMFFLSFIFSIGNKEEKHSFSFGCLILDYLDIIKSTVHCFHFVLFIYVHLLFSLIPPFSWSSISPTFFSICVLSSDYSAKPCLNPYPEQQKQNEYLNWTSEPNLQFSFSPSNFFIVIFVCVCYKIFFFSTFLCMSFVFLCFWHTAFEKLYYHILFFICLLPFV